MTQPPLGVIITTTMSPVYGPWPKEVSDCLQRYDEALDRLRVEWGNWFFRRVARDWYRRV